MFDIGWTEMALIVGAAVIVIGPKDMPAVLYRAGKMTRQLKTFMHDIQASVDKITREAEVDDLARSINQDIGGPEMRARIEKQIAVEEQANEPDPKT